MYKLFCENNPKELGIEGKDGWDMEKFREHILACKICQQACQNIVKILGSTFPIETPAEQKYSVCGYCGHEWVPKVDKPKVCPRCKSYNWNKTKNIKRRDL